MGKFVVMGEGMAFRVQNLVLWYDGIAIKERVDDFEAKGVRMTRKYRLERTAFIGCRNTAYMDVDDAEPCPFCGSRQVTIYPYGQGTTSYVEGVPTLFICHLQMPRLYRRD